LLILVITGLMVALLPLPQPTAVPSTRHINITAEDFGFTPGVIRVNPGDRVTLELEAGDVVHGLYLDEYALAVTAEPGQPAAISFVADRTGTFRWRCSVTCGALHPFMMGKLQVGINWLFWRALALALSVVLLGLAIAANRYEPAYQSGELA
jgi:heme/copper-type cytochrome/quinol oxidase subunit 2